MRALRAALNAVDPWAWPPLLMAVIFVLSAQPDLSTGLGLADLVARKIAHALIYAALCLSWWRLLATRTSVPRAVVLASAITILYAVSDEWHQSLVPGRTGSVLDVAIDALGAGLAVAVGLRASSRRERRAGARSRYEPRRAP